MRGWPVKVDFCMKVRCSAVCNKNAIFKANFVAEMFVNFALKFPIECWHTIPIELFSFFVWLNEKFASEFANQK